MPRGRVDATTTAAICDLFSNAKILLATTKKPLTLNMVTKIIAHIQDGVIYELDKQATHERWADEEYERAKAKKAALASQ